MGVIPLNLGKMAIVSVDDRGRITIPKEMGIRNTRAIIIPAGSFLITISLPKSPQTESEGGLETEISQKELQRLAEKRAGDDAIKRAKRRNQT